LAFRISDLGSCLYAALDCTSDDHDLRLLSECAVARRIVEYREQAAGLLQGEWKASLHDAHEPRRACRGADGGSGKMLVFSAVAPDESFAPAGECEQCCGVLRRFTDAPCVPRADRSTAARFV